MDSDKDSMFTDTCFCTLSRFYVPFIYDVNKSKYSPINIVLS